MAQYPWPWMVGKREAGIRRTPSHEHFERFAGYEARIETAMAIDGRKRFRGRLGGIEGDNVLLQVDKNEWMFPFPDIQKAKLIVTDEMLAEAEGRK